MNWFVETPARIKTEFVESPYFGVSGNKGKSDVLSLTFEHKFYTEVACEPNTPVYNFNEDFIFSADCGYMNADSTVLKLRGKSTKCMYIFNGVRISEISKSAYNSNDKLIVKNQTIAYSQSSSFTITVITPYNNLIDPVMMVDFDAARNGAVVSPISNIIERFVKEQDRPVPGGEILPNGLTGSISASTVARSLSDSIEKKYGCVAGSVFKIGSEPDLTVIEEIELPPDYSSIVYPPFYPNNNVVVSSPYGIKRPAMKFANGAEAPEGIHTGTDFVGSEKEKHRIVAVYPCRVVYRNDNSETYGNYVVIELPRIPGFNETLYCAYAHMHSIDSGITVGKQLKAGEPIGYQGNTGWSGGTHLHFEVRVGSMLSSTRTMNPDDLNRLLKGSADSMRTASLINVNNEVDGSKQPTITTASLKPNEQLFKTNTNKSADNNYYDKFVS